MSEKETVIIAGAGGFIGRALINSLGEYVLIPLRREDLYGESEVLRRKIGRAEVIINLAGESIFGVWSKKKKRKIRESRMVTTSKIVRAIEKIGKRNMHLINASAVGIYPEEGKYDEESREIAGNFLADVVRDWEGEAVRVKKYGAKVTIVRLGIVLGRDGGAYGKMTGLRKTGLNVIMGSGKQKLPFVHIDDLVEIFRWIIRGKKEGIINAVAPELPEYHMFSRMIAGGGRRKKIRLPDWMLRTFMGESSIMLTRGQDVVPGRLMGENFHFQYPDIISAINQLNKTSTT